jgi:2-polyprenyl-3-methyl-5-hydroxy-6-metoxy-1,4-benzoquinol methylase
MNTWTKANQWETEWWNSLNYYANTLNEEMKQLIYAQRMGIRQIGDAYSPYWFDGGGKRILDIGGGPVSLLLKCKRTTWAKVVDPLEMPIWVLERYKAAEIEVEQIRGEDLLDTNMFDEVWIYNCLQHTEDPVMIIENAFRAAPVIRLFEWINTEPNIGHPQTLTEKMLNQALGGEGKTERMDSQGLFGLAYYGIFEREFVES